MPTPRLSGAPPRGTPGDLTTTGGRPRRLPEDLLRQARKRLQILALIAAALWVLGPVLGHVALHFAHPDEPMAGTFRTIDAIALFAFSTSIGLYFYLRRTRRDAEFVLDLGLAYLVLTAIDMA